MDMLGKDDIIALLHSIRVEMESKRDRLIEIDGAMGDGDLGLTMVKAFVAADERASASDLSDLGKLLMHVGMAMAKIAPSTMGTLVATGFMRGGKALAGKEVIGPADLAAFFAAFAEGIRERGKTEVGNKTILDVMQPAAEAAANAATGDSGAVRSGAGSIEAVLSATRDAARDGWEAAKSMQAQHGRQAYYREKSVGQPDPGATAGLYMIEAMYRAVCDAD